MYFFALLLLLGAAVFQITALSELRRYRKKAMMGVLGVYVICGSFLLINIYQSTPFFNAVEAGDLAGVNEMLAKNPSLIRSETFMGSTALHKAVFSNNSDMVQLLIKDGADVNAPGYAETPLHVAAFYGHAKIAEILLNAGANVNALGYKWDDTPLQVAAIHGNADVVKVLLSHGANLNAEDKNRETALQLAQEYNQTDIVSILAKK